MYRRISRRISKIDVKIVLNTVGGGLILYHVSILAWISH